MIDASLASERVIERVALVFRALGDRARLRILCAIGAGEKSVGAIAALARTSQASASRHLQALREAGIVTRRREGAQVHYRLADVRYSEMCGKVAEAVSAEQPATISPKLAAELFRIEEGAVLPPGNRAHVATRKGKPRRSP